ncbi:MULTISPECIES: CpaD family pilus assembly protein [unclassified Methylobacterium]|uniref:CpaD family pilus assembly protein n=1 Tax=unclassified Methylobacterium TaxID=2615210 RepID=UPI0006FCC4AA|nr:MULTISPECIES: CpaD family pilus assembly protein [unclassified Methylobacterium]KQP85441.1 pilus assembly protein CpaD [Methylobacterium sp. Leaf113]KQP96695.1 pilus assembly protein CpaD [Methylobacterium sp. Leaf117]MCK2052825.1 CpaD family pilus assembly protein [Methylobacterium sp. 37f]
MSHSSPRTPMALAAIAGLAALLGACRANPVATTGSLYPVDYRARHPIALTEGVRTLDVFVTGTGHLDPRQAADVDAFLLEFRRYGRGTLVLDLPGGIAPAQGAAVERTAAALRRMGADGGVPGRQIVISHYAVANPNLASPLRLSFQRMEAKVASQCGTWPQDLGVGDAPFNGRNETYWNFGCASQSNFAAQVADPVDLVRARPEGRIDTIRRTNDIGKIRDGKDPSIEWRQDGKTSVKSQVSQ